MQRKHRPNGLRCVSHTANRGPTGPLLPAPGTISRLVSRAASYASFSTCKAQFTGPLRRLSVRGPGVRHVRLVDRKLAKGTGSEGRRVWAVKAASYVGWWL